VPAVDRESCQFLIKVTHYLDCFRKAAWKVVVVPKFWMKPEWELS